jgi:hypothetical protein
MTAKQKVIETVRRLPEKASLKTIAYEVELLAAIGQVEEDIKKAGSSRSRRSEG